MRRLALSVLGTALAVSAGGCCTWKSMLGSTGYEALVRASEDANRSGPTRVLVVWPSPAQTQRFRDIESIDDAQEELKLLVPGTDYEVADLQTVYPGDEKIYDLLMVGGSSTPLRTHCQSTHVFVFTSIPDGTVVEPLSVPGRAFAGYLQVELERDGVQVRFDEFERQAAER